jgi:hypothetical protein
MNLALGEKKNDDVITDGREKSEEE